MEFQEVIEKRYSARAFKPQAVEPEKLQRILEAARLAPTAANLQPFQFIVIHTAGRKEELKRIYMRNFFWEAPLVICACTLPGQSWSRKDGKNYSDIDVAIAMDHLILAATDQGLGTCWVGAFDPEAARQILGLPPGVEPVVFTPLGYPVDKPGPKKRKALFELVRNENW